MRKRKLVITLVCAMTIGMELIGCTSTADNTNSKPSTQVEKSTTQKADNADKKDIKIINSYDNTEELKGKFKIVNDTSVKPGIEAKIQNRLLTGFANWNMGYDAWKEWGNILYTPDSLYNVHGVHLTLPEYQMSQKMGLQATDIQMGDFTNMIINDDWCAIRYNITSQNRKVKDSTPSKSNVIEFVNFKDYGNEKGTRVVEGWAGNRGADFEALTNLQTDKEKTEQKERDQKVLDTVLPKTDNLDEKYPIMHATNFNGEKNADTIKEAILQDFDHWNTDYDTWSKWADTFYCKDAAFSLSGQKEMNLDEYKAYMKQNAEKTDVKRVQIENMLIRDDWAAIYYKTVDTDKKTGKKTLREVKNFLHFENVDGKLVVTESLF